VKVSRTPSADGLGSTLVVKRSSAESDRAVALFFARFLEQEQPGTSWAIDTNGKGESVKAA
jgi:hypothetical protein